MAPSLGLRGEELTGPAAKVNALALDAAAGVRQGADIGAVAGGCGAVGAGTGGVGAEGCAGAG